MSAPQQTLAQLLKHSTIISHLSNTTFVEVIGESLNRRLPLNYRVMRLVSRSNYLREAAIHYYCRRKRAGITTTSETIFSGLNVENAIRQLNEKGFAAGVVLLPDYIAQIMAFCFETTFIDDYNKDPLRIELADERVPRPGRLAYRCPNPHQACDAVDKLTRDPALVEVARGYLKTEPLLRSSRIFWSYPDLTGDYNPLYGFHYDIDDYKFLKVFFYLCDVDLDRGPHIIIEGTHKKKNWFEKSHRRLTDEQALSRYADRIRIMTGRTGHGFFEDTFCYHKGAKPRKRRLVLEFEYAISSVAKC